MHLYEKILSNCITGIFKVVAEACGLYFKRITIVIDAARVVSK
jgi:hypothetical protein